MTITPTEAKAMLEYGLFGMDGPEAVNMLERALATIISMGAKLEVKDAALADKDKRIGVLEGAVEAADKALQRIEGATSEDGIVDLSDIASLGLQEMRGDRL